MEWAVGLFVLVVFFCFRAGWWGGGWLFRLDWIGYPVAGVWSVFCAGRGVIEWMGVGEDRRIPTWACILDRTRIPGSVYRPFKRSTD